MKVLNFGSLNLDYVYRVNHFVQPGETLACTSQAVNPGGKGLNQSIALAWAGAKVYHAGAIGRGGEELGRLLRQNGVDTTFLTPVDVIQGNTVIQVTPSGENCILLYGGSNQCITGGQVERTISSFSEGDWLVLQNEINGISTIVDQAFARGMHIILNPSPCNDRIREVDFAKLSWLIVNEVEAEQLTGSPEPSAAWRYLHRKYPQLSLLVTLGSRGSTAYRVMPGGDVRNAKQKAFSVKAVDTTAAGDTYTGFFIESLMEHRPLEECMVRASMAAALCVTREGAARSIPSRREVENALGMTADKKS